MIKWLNNFFASIIFTLSKYQLLVTTRLVYFVNKIDPVTYRKPYKYISNKVITF